jgi:NitT/TauT family transport system substrate-binding protein
VGKCPRQRPHDRRTARGLKTAFLAAAAAAFLLSACGATASAPSSISASAQGKPAAASSAASAASKPNLKKLKYGSIHSVGADSAVFAALDQGYFAEQGIDLEIVDFATAVDMIPALGTGQIETGAGITSAALWNAVTRGVAVKVVAGTSQSDPGPPAATVTAFMVRKALVDSGKVKTMADIKGLNVVAPPPGNGVELLWSLIFKQAGLTRNDVNNVQLPITEVGAALTNGKVDVAATTEPSTTIVANQGAAVALLHDYDVYPNAQAGVLFYNPDFAKSDLAVPYMTAFLKGARLYTDAFSKNIPEARTKVIDALAAHTALKDKALFEKMVVPRIDPNGPPNVKSLQDQQDYFVSAGEQPKPVDINAVVDLSFAKAAAAKLGSYS